MRIVLQQQLQIIFFQNIKLMRKKILLLFFYLIIQFVSMGRKIGRKLKGTPSTWAKAKAATSLHAGTETIVIATAITSPAMAIPALTSASPATTTASITITSTSQTSTTTTPRISATAKKEKKQF